MTGITQAERLARAGILCGTLRYCGTGPFKAPKECQWIDGQPGDPICGKATVEGSAWCAEHKARAFLPTKQVGLNGAAAESKEEGAAQPSKLAQAPW